MYNDGVFILIDDDDIPFYSFIPGTSILIKYTIEFEEVVIRTNGGTLTVNAPADTVKHYGEAQVVTLTAVGTSSYYEHGSVNLVDIKKGRLVITNDTEAEVATIYLSATGDAYDEIIIATQSGSKLPDVVAREQVSNPTIVVTIQTNVDANGENPTKTEEIKLNNVYDVKEATNGYAVSDLGLLVVEAISADGIAEAAGQITDEEVLEAVKVSNVSTKEEVTAAATLFAGGKGTADKPYLIGTAQHWNNFYQRVYDWKGDTIPYFELTNDIDLTGKHIKNYAMDGDEKVAKFFMWFDLDGNDHTVKGITYLDGYSQVFPYILDANIHDITIDYNLDETRTAAMVYSPAGDNYFTNVTTTGSIATTANWATAYVAYMYKEPDYNSNVTYTNVVNYANIKGSYGNNGYTAVFGSHNGGGGHITFDNVINYGTLLGGHVGFVGMGNDSAYTFVDSNAVKNYGTMVGTKSVGYFNNSGDATSKTIGGVTSEVKQASASKSLATTHTNTAPANFGDVITINEVEGATKYEVQMSISIGVYNYSTVGPRWGGGFPRSMTFVYTEDDVKDGKIATDLIKGYFGEIKEEQYYGYGDTMPTYSGMFLPVGFDLKSNYVTILGNQGDLYLVEYEENQFYVLYSEDYPGCYTLLSTNDAGEITTKNLTVSFSVTAYNPNGSVLSCSSFSYTASVDDAISFFNGLGNNLNE